MKAAVEVRPTGSQLYFLRDTVLFSASFATEPAFRVTSITKRFVLPGTHTVILSPDGTRFLMLLDVAPTRPEIRVVLNWIDHIRTALDPR